jgi:hypothetical protein
MRPLARFEKPAARATASAMRNHLLLRFDEVIERSGGDVGLGGSFFLRPSAAFSFLAWRVVRQSAKKCFISCEITYRVWRVTELENGFQPGGRRSDHGGRDQITPTYQLGESMLLLKWVNMSNVNFPVWEPSNGGYQKR